MSIGDWITWICLGIAVWYVPRYLLRIYAPGFLPWLRSWWQAGIDAQRARYEKRAAVYGLRDYSSDTSAAPPVPPQQHQAIPALVPDFEAVKHYLTEHNLTDEQAIDLFALARRQDGSDYLSANKIREIVGGNESKVKAQVATHRRARPRPKVSSYMPRPKEGW